MQQQENFDNQVSRVWFELDVRSRKSATILISIIVLFVGISYIGTLPVHRISVSHVDDIGDVSDPNVDIESYRSYLENNYIILELVVVGNIISNPDSLISSNYMYRLIVVAKSPGDDRSHIYSCRFQDGEVGQYFLNFEVYNNTLRIFFPFSQFIPDSYMIGLEASAYSVFGDQDIGLEDRDSEVQRLFF